MNARTCLLPLLVLLAACGPKRDLDAEVRKISGHVDEARRIRASVCAPDAFARAETQLAFARVEFDEADPRRAAEHLDAARSAVDVALTAARSCSEEDADNDGVPDAVDQCPDVPEDRDGNADDDGCPDVSATGDMDGDGVDNADDQCLNEPEDRDGHEDEDGCPEDSPDRDEDGVPDALDACPDDAEDLDRFEDEDGCPDPDDDGDGIPDVVDACPSDAEDMDRFEDGDGCPESDNDGDGVADAEDECPTLRGMIAMGGCPADDKDRDGVRDAFDECPNEKENRNGVADDDGCPDAVASTARREGDRLLLDAPLPFLGNELPEDAGPAMASIARMAADHPGVLRVRSHVDATSDPAADKLRSELRGMAVRAALVEAGVEASRLAVEAVGGAEPVDTNRTSSGRRRNRRIEFLLD